MHHEQVKQYIEDRNVGKQGFRLMFGVLGAVVGSHFIDGLSPDFISSEGPANTADFYKDCSDIFTNLVETNAPESVFPGNTLTFTFDIEDVPEKCSDNDAVIKLNNLLEESPVNVVTGSATVTEEQGVRIDKIERVMNIEMATPGLMAAEVRELESTARHRRIITSLGGALIGGLIGFYTGSGIYRLLHTPSEDEMYDHL